jgi:hypothetical protein
MLEQWNQSLTAAGRHERKKHVFTRKRIMKVEMQFLASLLLRGALLFFCFGKKSKRRNNFGFSFCHRHK